MTNFQETQGEKEHDNAENTVKSNLQKTAHSNKITIKFSKKRKKIEMKGVKKIHRHKTNYNI